MLDNNIGKKNYLKAEDLLIEFNKSSENNEATEQLIKYFQKIATGFARKFIYNDKYLYKVCINYAVSEAWRKWRMYNSEKSTNIFSFYTTMIANDLRIAYKQNSGKSCNISIDALLSNKQN